MTIAQTHRKLSNELLNWSQRYDLTILTIAAMSLQYENYVPEDVIQSTKETMAQHVREILGHEENHRISAI